MSHLGPIGLQVVCPNLTKSSLSSSQYLFGTFFVSSSSVCSGVFVCDEAEPVGDPVDVGVHGDRRLVEPVDQDAVRGLPSDRVKGEQALQVVGDLPAELFDDLLGDPYHVPGLDVVEPHRPYQLLHLPGSALASFSGVS